MTKQEKFDQQLGRIDAQTNEIAASNTATVAAIEDVSGDLRALKAELESGNVSDASLDKLAANADKLEAAVATVKASSEALAALGRENGPIPDGSTKGDENGSDDQTGEPGEDGESESGSAADGSGEGGEPGDNTGAGAGEENA